MDPKVKFGVADLHFFLIGKLNRVKKDEIVDCQFQLAEVPGFTC